MTGRVSCTSHAECKPSGDKWLRCVPEHWDISPLKCWVGVNEAVLPETTGPDFEFSYLDIGAIGNGQLVEQPRQIRFSDAPSRARRIVRQNDTIISTVRTYLKAVWFAGRVNDHLVCSTGFAVLTPRRGADPKYVSYLVRSKLFTDRVTSESIGMAYPAISEGRLSSFHVCVPPLDEQTAIVRYLDHADSRIKRYISAKERLIELLSEQKQAIINQAVTFGLDPDVPLKPSGVEWLGDVPAHWDVKRAKYFYREVDERSSSGMEELMSVSHKTGVTPRKNSVTMFMAESNVGYKICRPGDIAINTMWAYMAALGVARQVGLISPSYGVYRPRVDRIFNLDYIDPLLRTEGYRSEYLCRSTGITSSRLRLYPDSFLGIPLLHPPFEEQVAIVEHLGNATAETANLINRAHRQIDLMNEYRSRLIADVVTGKLDVRNAMDGLDQGADLVTAGSQQLELDMGR